MSFHVGQKVECVDDRPRTGFREFEDCERPILGTIYTVRRSFLDDDGDEIVWLYEIARGPIARRHWGPEVGYAAWRFRPIVSRSTETGMAILRQILADHKAPVKEKA